MKVMFDHQTFTAQQYGGISQYFIELYRNLNGTAHIPDYISPNEYYCQFRNKQPYNFNGGKYTTLAKYHLVNYLNTVQSLRELRNDGVDILHPTYYDTYFLNHIGKTPYVLTVYDMIHDLQPQMFPDSARIIQNRKRLIAGAAKVIAISENTKRDICRLYGTDPGKIEVTHLGTSVKPNGTTMPALPEKYLLYVGTRAAPYKGFRDFISAAEQVMNEDPAMHVVCAGGGPFTVGECGMTRNPSRIHQVSVTADTIATVYQKADLFVFPSHYEGFGIPLLESMSCGCPVVCGDIPTSHEVAGDAALYYPHDNPRAMHDAIIAGLNGERQNLVRKGLDRIPIFSWKKTADQTKRIYENVLEDQ